MRKMKLIGMLAAALAIVAFALVTQGDVSAASLTTRIQVNVVGTLTDSTTLTDNTATISKVWTTSLANGTGASQADKIYTLKEQTIADGGTLSIDVKASLTDAFGAAFTPAKLKTIYIGSVTTNTTALTLFGDANSVPILGTAATTTTLAPGGSFLMVNPSAAGIAVTAGTGDIIKIVNAAGAAAKVDVILVGTSS